MRSRSVGIACWLAAFLLVLALRGAWGGAPAQDGTRLKVSLHGVTQVLTPRSATSPTKSCDYLKGTGDAQLCAPAENRDVAFSILCAAFPLLATGLALTLVCALMLLRSRRRPSTKAAALCGAALAAALSGTALALIGMPRALAVLDGLALEFGSLAFSAAWLAMVLLAFATTLATAIGMRGHPTST